jgi:SET domain-containing protein
MIVELDNGRFMNHSTSPNTRFTDPDAGFTRVAIAAHEEITCDYSEFDPAFQMLPGRLFVSAE